MFEVNLSANENLRSSFTANTVNVDEEKLFC